MTTDAQPLLLSVLDQSPVRAGGSAAASIRESVALAEAAEAAGYHRYWLAEHHATPALAGPAPEILVARIAAATQHMRIGTGGVMLSHYSPLKVAETFRVLEALYPGRIDLGIGRAPGSDGLTAAALAYGSAVGTEYFPTRVADMMAFLSDTPPVTDAFSPISVTPKTETRPEVWLLGSSDQSALLAAKFGLAFSFAQFITSEGGDEVVHAYRNYFQPSEFYGAPRASLGVFVICAETEEEAMRLGKSRDLAMLLRTRAGFGPFPSVEEAEAYPYTAQDLQIMDRNRQRCFYGDPDQCRERLTALAEAYAVDELVVLTITYDPEARRRSYELLAEAFALNSVSRGTETKVLV